MSSSPCKSPVDSVNSSQQSSPGPAAPAFIPNHLLSQIPESKRIVPLVLDDSSDSEVEEVSERELISYYVSPSKPDKRRLLGNLTEFSGTNVIRRSYSRANLCKTRDIGSSGGSLCPLGMNVGSGSQSLVREKSLLNFSSMKVVGLSEQEMHLNSPSLRPRSMLGGDFFDHSSLGSPQCNLLRRRPSRSPLGFLNTMPRSNRRSPFVPGPETSTLAMQGNRSFQGSGEGSEDRGNVLGNKLPSELAHGFAKELRCTPAFELASERPLTPGRHKCVQKLFGQEEEVCSPKRLVPERVGSVSTLHVRRVLATSGVPRDVLLERCRPRRLQNPIVIVESESDESDKEENSNGDGPCEITSPPGSPGKCLTDNINAVVRTILGKDDSRVVVDSQENNIVGLEESDDLFWNTAEATGHGSGENHEPEEPFDSSSSPSSDTIHDSNSSSEGEQRVDSIARPVVETGLRFHDRTKGNEPGKKKVDRMKRKDNVTETHLKRRKMKDIFLYPCCDKLCLKDLGRLGSAKQRVFYFGLSRAEKNIFLRGCMVDNGSQSTYSVNGQSCCRKGFKKLFSVGNNRLQKINSNKYSRILNVPFCRETTTTHLNVELWLNDFFTKNVESLPNREIHNLPDNWTKQEVYMIFKSDTAARQEVEITYSYFCRIWQDKYSRVRIPSRSRFSTCGPCTELKALRDKATLEEEKKKYADLLNEHRVQQQIERAKLAKHREKCYKHPEKYLGICIDGMDQKKTELPHFLRVPKNMDEKFFIPIHVVGCLVFNGKLSSKVFLTYPNLHNDANLTIHVIQHVLNNWEGTLPPVLYLQLDNTGRENKNKFLMAYLAMLVELGVFQKIKVGFLLVGHTHDQIDQMFSKFSVKLNKNKAFRLNTLADVIRTSYKPEAEMIFVDETGDFRKFVLDKDQPNDKGCVGRVLKDLQQISFQRQFRFKRKLGEDGISRTKLHAKKLSSTTDWGSPVEFLNYIPTSQIWVAPQMPLKCAGVHGRESKRSKHRPEDDDSESDDGTEEAMKVALLTLERYHKEIVEEGNNYFFDEDKLWWGQFFDTQRDILKNHLKSAEWQFFWKWPNVVDRTAAHVRVPDVLVDPELREMVAGPDRTMYSGPRRKTTSVGDFKDLEVNNKWSMLAVAAGDGTMPFWLAKVMKVVSILNGIPEKVKVTWFTTEATVDDAFLGKYYPEKGTNGKLLQTELVLSEVIVFAYNFCLLESKMLPVKTKRIIEEARTEMDEAHE